MVTKRCFDLLVGSLMLLLLLPVLFLCMLAVWLDSGSPVFFTQARLGLNGRLFNMLKFRSMHVNSADLRNPDGTTYNSSGDLRVTRVGRWLRKSSIDEFPQLINVVRGDMSIVGPRPELPDGLKHYRKSDHLRLTVRPGITGWAQIRGRNAISIECRRDLDVFYVQHRTLWMDIQIILLTIPTLLSGQGIYVENSQQN
jgi:lipopolysaccharide/colanic/teichoic acid biosynthesis glycosyltransferase